jgi:Domain of unknown function (DUF4832)/Domain of unknown function (DUF4874)
MTPARFTTARALLALVAVLHLTTLGASGAEKLFAPDAQSDFPNPERGLYTQFTAQAEQNPLTLEELQALRDNNMTLLLRMYYLKTFRDKPLSEAQLTIIQNDFAIIREAGVKCVLRFAYSQGIGEPDAPIDIVLKHMDQLAPILRDNADVIATVQTGFIGAWGEWHASTNNLAEPENAKQIVNKWLDILPPQRTVQLRTPRQKWMFLDNKTPLQPDTAFTETPAARIGHHNDCFLSSDTDVGTYEDADIEKQYLHLETRFVPMGGETCAKAAFSQPDNARKEMENLHFSYLNLGYHPDVINAWRDNGYLDEVQRRLGYRLTLNSIEYPESASQGETLAISLSLSNTGFAAPYNPRRVELTLIAQDGSDQYTTTLPDDPRLWLPGNPITINTTLNVPADIKPGKYSLSLALPDPEPALEKIPHYAIRLANPDLWDPATGQHDLGITIQITE